jgi:predicted nucleic acid-binding protein
VSTSKEIVVQDACVIFDLIDLGLIHPFFELALTVITTKQVIKEVEDGEQLMIVSEFMTSGRLSIDDLGEVESINKILFDNSGLSFADSSVLEVAIRRNGVVLSSDLKLRNATVRNSLTVRGILWIIGELHLNGRLTTQEAIDKLRTYQDINDRAPRKEIKIMIERLTSDHPE